MFDVNSITPRNSFKYWFQLSSLDEYEVMEERDSGHSPVIGTYNPMSGMLNLTPEHQDDAQLTQDILDAYELFTTGRPEAMIGRLVTQDALDEGILDTVYDTLLAATLLIQFGDKSIPRIQTCLAWLHRTDFYQAPGSTIYHDSEPTGLIKHTLRVVNNMLELSKIPQFSSVDLADAIYVALVHDWCKINRYESYMRNVKDESTGQWNKVPAYKRVDSQLPFEHGTASMFLAQKFFPLSTSSALAIHWHMSAWNACDKSYDELQCANAKYPIVLMLQFADQLSITNY